MTSSSAATRLGFEPFVNTSPVELRANWTGADVITIITCGVTHASSSDLRKRSLNAG